MKLIQPETPGHAHLTGKEHVTIARLRQAVQIKQIDSRHATFRTAAKAGAVAVVAICFLFAVRAIAGRTTLFSASVDAMFHMSADRWIAYIVASMSCGGYYYERRTRRKTIKEQAEYIEKLERKIDPKRSSSGLTITGVPPKEEELDAS